MKTDLPLVDKDYLLQKIEGKGGWTYAEIPEIVMPKTTFGILKVKGKIDDYELSNVRLMPLGNGNLLLPIRFEIRKRIKKQAGDSVHILLYKNDDPIIISDELLLCMEYEDGTLNKFENYTDGEKKAYIDWIYSAKTEQTKADRIAKTILIIQNGEKFYDKNKNKGL